MSIKAKYMGEVVPVNLCCFRKQYYENVLKQCDFLPQLQEQCLQVQQYTTNLNINMQSFQSYYQLKIQGQMGENQEIAQLQLNKKYVQFFHNIHQIKANALYFATYVLNPNILKLVSHIQFNNLTSINLTTNRKYIVFELDFYAQDYFNLTKSFFNQNLEQNKINSIKSLKKCNFCNLKKISIKFNPTKDYQSISSMKHHKNAQISDIQEKYYETNIIFEDICKLAKLAPCKSMNRSFNMISRINQFKVIQKIKDKNKEQLTDW